VRQLKIKTDILTSRTENISRYFSDVSGRPILSSEEEFKIGLRAQEGDEKAIEQLISSNLRFVVSVAKQYATSGVLLEELICQGNIGLCDAARMFDPTRGFKFISFAVWHIRKEILSYLNSDNRTVRVPQNVLNDLSKIRKADETILQEKGRYGTIEEIQEELSRLGKEVSIDYLKKITHADAKGIPLETSELEDANSPIDWLISDMNTSELLDQSDLSHTVETALRRLTKIQRDVVVSRLGLNGQEPDTFSTIAERYDRTPEWARALYVKSLKIMRVKLNSAKLTQDRVLNCEV
jgi:RNA polymerase primary sigma factor